MVLVDTIFVTTSTSGSVFGETILGLAVAANLAALMLAKPGPARITLGIHLFVLAGVSLGMVALALRVGPPPSPDWTLQYVMLAGIGTVIVLTLLRRRPEAG